MNRRLFYLILTAFLLFTRVNADIAPNPIVVKGIYTNDSCKIQMTEEYVYADLFNDSAKVSCTFELLNHGESITIQVGFPVMNFQYWSMGDYSDDDKSHFRIFVDNKMLTEEDIGVPSELDSIYNAYMYIYHIEKEYQRKMDSIYSANNVTIEENVFFQYSSNPSYQAARAALEDLFKWRETKPHFGSDLWQPFGKQMEKGNFPWYVWNVHFYKNERKQIKVEYSLPSGQGYGADYRYFKYILETGSGWYGLIEKADIELKLHDIKLETLEEISPFGYQMAENDKIIKWSFTNFEPSQQDDIYVKYYNKKERKDWQRYKRKRKRAIFLRKVNPVNWFR
ncbi:hypothetical protein [Proteiniphilum sp. X52]|uniref:hypothetical protein n=1 Tax=Proteiniphilum sp. X52 TaxID=2382159 RepID=UPI0011CE17EE|nr:hypothetical protein [Proteiniphilum sp. X52]